jgi:glyoxylase-like metal-dependent hydrolase (beta-lactamase superfamily II)
MPAYLHPDEELTSAWATPENHDRFGDWLAEHGVDPVTAAPLLLAVTHRGREPLPRQSSPLAHGQLLRVGRAIWRVLHTPGHTPGHVCLFRESDGTLLTGDHLLPNESPNISVRPGQPYNPLGRYLAALAMVGEVPTLDRSAREVRYAVSSAVPCGVRLNSCRSTMRPLAAWMV